jgi:FAD/FMN-containing dehydrogenase
LKASLGNALAERSGSTTEARALYATDGSNYRQVPIGVVVITVEQCRRFGAPLLARGGGTSLAGQCCNVAVVLDFTKYLKKLIDLDRQAKTAAAEFHLRSVLQSSSNLHRFPRAGHHR